MRRLRVPDPLTLLTGCVLVAALLTHVLPAGRYERRDDPATHRSVVVAGTYARVAPAPVGPFAALVALPKGMADAGSVIFLVFLVGGAFTVVDETGALKRAVDALVHALKDRGAWVIPLTALAFATAGALENMQEEIIAFVPLLLLLTRRLGFDAITAMAVSVGAAAVGAAFSPINPFQVGIAQKLAELPLLSGWAFRSLFLALALTLWIVGTLRHAHRTRSAAAALGETPAEALGRRDKVILVLVLSAFATFVYGVLRLGWDFDQMSALFFFMGVTAGLVGGLGVGGTSAAFVEGFRGMAGAAMVIGFARAIYVVLDDGRIIDTIVDALFRPIASLPTALAAFGIMGVEALVHVPVPSVSGEAVLTMPLLVPLSDLLRLSRQVTVLAYQYGAGLCELATPTNGALMAILAAAGVRYEDWMRFALPLCAALFALGLAALALGVAIGLR
jgi:uncharacterized ion transporter superfamily protein YfcC